MELVQRNLEMEVEDFMMKYFVTKDDRRKILETMSLIKMKCENLE